MTTPASTPASSGPDLDAIRAIVEPIAQNCGAELVAVEWKTDGRGFVLRVLVDKAGSAEKRAQTQESAVDLEVCANISRAFSAVLDTASPDPVPGHYSLEVGSPGVERDLRTEHDYVRFAGQKAKLRLSSPLDGQRVLTGVLGGLVDGQVTLAAEHADAKPRTFPLSKVVSARLVFEFGPAPKPGKKNRK